MKVSILSSVATVALVSQTCTAFTATRNLPRTASVALNASSDDENSTLLSRRTATAAMFFSAVAGAPLVSKAVEATLDFSLPSSYDTKMSGFGEGKEAFVKKGSIGEVGSTADALMTDPGADEKEKQLASMRKAEEARKEALAKKNAERKALEEEAKRRAAEKKARDKERLKNIWSS